MMFLTFANQNSHETATKLPRQMCKEGGLPIEIRREWRAMKETSICFIGRLGSLKVRSRNGNKD